MLLTRRGPERNASRVLPRTKNTTSLPPAANRPPKYPPTAPAPITAILIRVEGACRRSLSLAPTARHHQSLGHRPRILIDRNSSAESAIQSEGSRTLR